MKKISRIQKSKIIEKVKTVILGLLFLSCVFFGYQIFETYNEQTLIDGLWSGASIAGNTQNAQDTKGETESGLFEHFSEPVYILANGTQSRTEIKSNSKEFKELEEIMAKAISDMYGLSENEVQESTFDEWATALKAKSIYLRYPEKRYFWYESAFYQKEAGEISAFGDGYDEVLIAFGSGNGATMFLRDRQKGKILKTSFEVANKEVAFEILDKYESKAKKEYAFAHELNLDEKSYDRPMMDSMLVVTMDQPKASEIVVDIPRLYKIGLNITKTTDFTTNLLKVFGYNPNTVRQYANSEDALIFVGETGSLSIYPEGRIEYKALGSNEGISLNSVDRTGTSAISSGVFALINKLIEINGIDIKNADFDIKFTKMPQNITSGMRKEVSFDYFVDGKKIVFGSGPAIRAIVEDGALVEFYMQVKSIEKLTAETALDNIFTAIDESFKTNPKIRMINDGDIVYEYIKNDENIKAKWHISGE